MEELAAQGVARAVGLANASMSQLSAILGSCKVEPAVNSVEVRLFVCFMPPCIPERSGPARDYCSRERQLRQKCNNISCHV